MLILAFDTATDVATSALVDDGEMLGERTSIARTLLEDVDALLRQALGAADARSRRDRGRHGTGKLHEHADRAGCRPRPRPRARGSKAPASRRSMRSRRAAEDALPVIDARRGEVFVPAGTRRTHPKTSPPTAGSAWETARCATATCSKRNGGVVPADDDPRHVPHARAARSALPRRSGPVDAIEPIYVRAPDAERMASMTLDLRRLELARPRRDRADRAGLVSDAVVAVDVRDGARQAQLAVARRSRRVRRAGRVPRPLAVRRRLARDERRRRPRGAPAGGRDRTAAPAARRDAARRAARLHARGARLERRRDQPLRALRVQAEGCPARVLHRQPGGRPHHVARPRRRDGPPTAPRASGAA